MAMQYINRLRGRTVVALGACCPENMVATMGNCRHKIKVLDIPLGEGRGGGAVVTNDKCMKAT